MAKKKEAYPKKILEKIKQFRLFDDTFMSKVFDGQKDAGTLLLQIIFDDKDIRCTSIHTQQEIKNLQGRSARIDMIARSPQKGRIAVEVQRDNRGASPKRARNVSSMLDANALKSGEDVTKLPETYVILITENDVLGAGKPIYHIERKIGETGEYFNDGEHIIYVNGETEDDSELGKLMHDFKCTEASEMNYDILAKRVRYFKETERGRKVMCTIMEEIINDENKEAIIRGFQSGALTKECAATMYPQIKMTVINKLYKEANNKPEKDKKGTK